MRQRVRDLAHYIAEDLLEGLGYLTILESAEEAGEVLTEEEFAWVCEAVLGARTTLDPLVIESRERLRNTVRKLSNVSGIDLSELIDEGYLTEDDLG